MRTILAFGALVVVGVSALSAAPPIAQEASPFRMEGTVTVEGTQQPVPGTTVQVLIESEREPKDRVRSAKTDESGKYSIALPPGHGWAWEVFPPAGYSLATSNDRQRFATTPTEPVFHKNYEVRKGSAWNMVLRAPVGGPQLPKTYISGIQQLGNEFVHAYVVVEGEPRGVLTLPDIGGTFTLQCADEQRSLIPPEPMKLTFEKGFRTDRVKSVRQLAPGETEMRDDQGRAATILGVSVEMTQETATLIVPVQIRQATDHGRIAGRVVDEQGRGIRGAKIRAALHGGGGSATSDFTALCDSDGAFRLSMPNLQDEFKVSLIVIAKGYGGLDTEPRKVDLKASQPTDVGAIKLPPAASVRLRIVGPEGQPLAGAILEPLKSYAAREQIVRTDEHGYCTLTGLSAGVQSFSARFGELTTHSSLPLVAGENESLVIKLALLQTAAAAPAEERRVALKKGTPAPAWEIAAWTDGKLRKLTDYRGQVVVLDFWGVWCGPCIGSIPAMKQLHERYAEKGVVFLGIHTAGTDMTVVQRLLKQQDWNTISGLDTGDDIATGATVRAYAVDGFPTVMVIDREGKVAYNGRDIPADEKLFMQQMEKLVKELGFPWPLDEGATPEQMRELMTKLNVAMHSREIDRALELPAK